MSELCSKLGCRKCRKMSIYTINSNLRNSRGLLVVFGPGRGGGSPLIIGICLLNYYKSGEIKRRIISGGLGGGVCVYVSICEQVYVSGSYL